MLADVSSVSQHTLYGVQHIHINLTLIQYNMRSGCPVSRARGSCVNVSAMFDNQTFLKFSLDMEEMLNLILLTNSTRSVLYYL